MSNISFRDTLEYLIKDWSIYYDTNPHLKYRILFFLPLMFHNPGMFFSLLFRFEHYLICNKQYLIRVIGNALFPIYFFLTYYILDVDISPFSKIGPGLYLHNKGIIATTFTIGKNARLIGPLTIGLNFKKTASYPRFGNNVTICTGARIIGSRKIGNNVTIGANAVVVKDFEDNVVLGGVPAKIIKLSD